MRLVANHADYGGAIVNYPGARLTLVDSTLDGNTRRPASAAPSTTSAAARW
jgi:hypothetical protein